MNTHDKLKEIVQAAIDGGWKFINLKTDSWNVTPNDYFGYCLTIFSFRQVTSSDKDFILTPNDFILTPDAMRAVFGVKTICTIFTEGEKSVWCFLDNETNKDCNICSAAVGLPAWKHHAITACDIILDEYNGIEAAIDYLYDEMIRRDI
jgi:hypothetical protein